MLLRKFSLDAAHWVGAVFARRRGKLLQLRFRYRLCFGLYYEWIGAFVRRVRVVSIIGQRDRELQTVQAGDTAIA